MIDLHGLVPVENVEPGDLVVRAEVHPQHERVLRVGYKPPLYGKKIQIVLDLRHKWIATLTVPRKNFIQILGTWVFKRHRTIKGEMNLQKTHTVFSSEQN